MCDTSQVGVVIPTQHGSAEKQSMAKQWTLDHKTRGILLFSLGVSVNIDQTPTTVSTGIGNWSVLGISIYLGEAAGIALFPSLLFYDVLIISLNHL